MLLMNVPIILDQAVFFNVPVILDQVEPDQFVGYCSHFLDQDVGYYSNYFA